jgi:two-component system, cell cycle sensor histidine kinase and response regulator CckA
MPRPLRVLMVEDSEDDAALLLAELRRGGYDPAVERVETAEGMRRALAGGTWDVILSDYRLPSFSGPAALALMQDIGLDLPFIIVSGTIGEETAVAALKAGAHDFVTKENLARLGPAIEREMREAANRRELRRTEDTLRRSEAYFRALIEHSLDSIAILDGEGRIKYESPSLSRLLGYEPRELEGRLGFDFVHPEDQHRVRELLAAAVADESLVVREEYRFRHRDGSWRTFEAVVSNLLHDPFVGGFVVNSRDVTERKRAEETLRWEQYLVTTLLEHTPDAIYFKDTESRFLRVNRGWAQRCGVADPAAAVGKTDADFFSREHAEAARQMEQDIMRTGRPVVGLEEMETWPDRPGAWVSTTKMPLRDAAGAITGTFGISRDITEQKAAGEALRRSEAEFRGLVEHAPVGIYRATRDGRFLTVNPALVRMLGYGWVEELLRLDVARDVYVNPDEPERLIRESPLHAEIVWKRKDGTPITVELTSHHIPSPDGREDAFEGVVVDVTQQRSLEAQFRQAQRLEAVGRLAGGVAHDFNNILTAITGYSDLLLEDLGPEDPKRPDVEEIQAAARRAAALTRQLLAFSRKQVFQTRVLDLNEVVRTLENMLRRLIGEDIKLEVALASGLGAVRADPGQIEQVILNLAVNSRDAMPGGGRLTIESANVDLDDAYAREHAGAVPGPYVLLAVSDTGVGIDAETRAHIFEPFFTTKEQGKGTGLGLATVYGIIKQSGGYVAVYSEPGRGATFKIYLPRVEATPDATIPALAEPPVAGGGETILLAEDDPSVRAVVSDVLAQKGYRVLRAGDGQSALEMAGAQPGRIHLLVTDLVMPGMTGRELADALTALRPGTPVLYISGYTDDAVVRHGVLEEGMPYLQKPFTPRALTAKVREVLDRSGERRPTVT